VHGAPILDDRAHDDGTRRLREESQFQEVLVHLAPLAAVAAESHENGLFQTVHRAILISGGGSVNAAAGSVAGVPF